MKNRSPANTALGFKELETITHTGQIQDTQTLQLYLQAFGIIVTYLFFLEIILISSNL